MRREIGPMMYREWSSIRQYLGSTTTKIYMGIEHEEKRKWKTNYITINKRFTNTVLHYKKYPSADGGSDNLPVIFKVRVKLQKLKRHRTAPKVQ